MIQYTQRGCRFIAKGCIFHIVRASRYGAWVPAMNKVPKEIFAMGLGGFYVLRVIDIKLLR